MNIKNIVSVCVYALNIHTYIESFTFRLYSTIFQAENNIEVIYMYISIVSMSLYWVYFVFVFVLKYEN